MLPCSPESLGLLPHVSSTDQGGKPGQVGKVALLLATRHSLLLAASPRLCSCLIKGFLGTDPERCSYS